MAGGKILKSGDKSLALELEQKGYGWIEQAAQKPSTRCGLSPGA